jgi:dCMP deaminase
MTRPDWDTYFMDIARAVALRSEDPSSKVGCVIVDKNNRPISFGYNGFITGCNEHGESFERPMKYNLVIHGEMNALLFAKRDLTGAKLYCTHAPCDNCLKHLLQSGIRYILFDETELLSRLSEESLIACLRLGNSVEMDSLHNTKGEWYGNIIVEELLRRGVSVEMYIKAGKLF